MAADGKKGITVKVDAALHAEITQYLQDHGMTMTEFVTLALQDELHPKIDEKEGKNMEKMRTLAFQVPESLFQRIKDYLHRNNMTQKDFVIGLIEQELDRDLAESQETGEAQGDFEDTEEPEDTVFRLLVAQTPMDDPEETIGSAEWISLPISQEQADQAANRQNEVCLEDCVYFDMESAIPQIDDQVFDSMDHFARLNQIAMQYQAMDEPEQIKYKAVLEAEPHLTMEKALELASHLPEYEFTPLPCDEANFFKEYLSHHLDARMDRRWLSTIATQAEGARLLQSLSASQTEYGILSARGHSLYELVPYGESSRELSTQALTDEKLEVVVLHHHL